MDKTIGEEIKVKGEELLKKVRELIHEGNVRRIIIKNEEGKVYLEVPVTVGVLGAVLVPLWAAIGALAAVAVSFKVEIIKKDDNEPFEAEKSEDSDSSVEKTE